MRHDITGTVTAKAFRQYESDWEESDKAHEEAALFAEQKTEEIIAGLEKGQIDPDFDEKLNDYLSDSGPFADLIYKVVYPMLAGKTWMAEAELRKLINGCLTEYEDEQCEMRVLRGTA